MDINRRVAELIAAGERFAVGLILSTEGSTPREAGGKAVLEAGGRVHGTLGGGPTEAEAQARAVEACRAGEAEVFEVELAGASAGDRGPICGGRMRLLVDPTTGKDAAAYEAAAVAREERRRGALVTAVMTDGEGRVRTATCWVAEGAEVAAPEAGPGTEVITEEIAPAPLLLIAGGGHIGQALAAQATLVGFDVTVLDDRPEFTAPALFPEGVRTRCCDVAGELAAQELSSDAYVVIVTRGHQHDAAALRVCLGQPVAYIGMIGSRRKVALMREEFLARGWANEGEFDRVYAPIGLDIGAETVPEIAASIVGQLIAVRRTGTAARMPRAADR